MIPLESQSAVCMLEGRETAIKMSKIIILTESQRRNGRRIRIFKGKQIKVHQSRLDMNRSFHCSIIRDILSLFPHPVIL